MAGVLHVIPDAERDAQQFVADDFVVRDRVELATPLEPPVAVLKAVDRAMVELVPGELAHPVRRDEGLRRRVLATRDEDRAAERLRVGLDGSEAFAVFRLALAAHAQIGPGLKTQAGIPRAIRKVPARDLEDFLGGIAQHGYGGDLVASRRHPAADAGRVQHERNALFLRHLFVKQQVPLRVAAVGLR